MLDVAQKEFSITLPNGNPVTYIRKPRDAGRRERRLINDEPERLMAQCKSSGNRWLAPAVTLALATAMRQGELLALEWKNVDLKRRFALLPMTKNGEARGTAIP